jgi:DnaJ domain
VDDPFKILGVTRAAPPEVIRAAYRALAQKYHPDRNRSADAAAAMQAVNEAYAILTDPVRRAAYESAESVTVNETEAASGTEPHVHPSEFFPVSIQRMVRDVGYEIVFLRGSVYDTREWVDYEQRVKRDHRLFVGRGTFVDLEQVPRQKVWVRTASRDVLLERTGTVLPVAAGHAVTLVGLRASGSAGEPQHIALVNGHTGRWYTLGKLGEAVNKVMPGRALAKDLLRTYGLMACGCALIYWTLLRSGNALTWLASLLIGIPLLWNLAPLLARTTHAAVEADILAALAERGLAIEKSEV